jgi:hypothetical protein
MFISANPYFLTTASLLTMIEIMIHAHRIDMMRVITIPRWLYYYFH